MEDSFLKLKYNINTDKFDIDSNIKLEMQGEIVSNFLRGQIGQGEDNREADKREIYEIALNLDLSCDKYTVLHNCGNKGLRDGILINFLKKSKS